MLCRKALSAKDKPDRRKNANRRGRIVPGDRLLHDDDRERDEHEKRDRLLNDFQLLEPHAGGVADAVRGNDKAVLD